MVGYILQTINLRENPNRKSKVLCSLPKDATITIVGKKYTWDKAIPFVKVTYKDKIGYVNAKYIKGLYLKKINNKSTKNPVTAVLSNGKTNKKVRIVRQYSFNEYVSSHGCSISCIVEALRSVNKGKTVAYIEKYCKTKLNGYNGSKVAIYGAYKVVKALSGKQVTYKSVQNGNKSEIRKLIKSSLKNGKCVVIEQKNPIHTYIALGFTLNNKIMIGTSGTLKEVSLNWIMKTINVGNGTKSDFFTGAKSDAGIFVI